MKRFLALVIAALGVWLVVSPWIIGYPDTAAKIHDAVVGAVLAAAAVFAFVSKEKLTPTKPFYGCAVIGLYLALSGLFFTGSGATASLVNGLVIGLLAAFLSAVATQVIEGRQAFIYTKEGVNIVEMNKIALKGGDIEVKGKAFSAMPQVMRLRPEELWVMLGLIPADVIMHLPRMLFQGWRNSRKKPEQ